MKFTNTEVMNFKGAFRGLRNPLESWDKSDSCFGIVDIEYDDYLITNVVHSWVEHEIEKIKLSIDITIEPDSEEWFKIEDKYWNLFYKQGAVLSDSKSGLVNTAYIGPNDMELAQRMIKAGASDRKFLRQIMVSADITAPLYWWKEMDTYKVGTVSNSTSTMHKLASTPITKECFEIDDENSDLIVDRVDQSDVTEEGKKVGFISHWHMDDFTERLIEHLEDLRQMYLKTKDKQYWKELIRWLPESWLQTRTWTANYEILRNIYSQRKNHRLTEWHAFCRWIETLPYANELILYNLD